MYDSVVSIRDFYILYVLAADELGATHGASFHITAYVVVVAGLCTTVRAAAIVI